MATPELSKPMTRRSALAEKTRRKILAVALDQFSRHSYSDVTVADIALAAEVAKGLVFHHFGSKDGLYLEALRVASADLDAAHQTDPEAPSGQRIVRRLRAHLSYLADHEELALNLILHSGEVGPEVSEAFESLRWTGIDWTCRLLGLDPEQPSLRLMVRSFAIAADEVTIRWLKQGHPFDIDLVVDALVALLVGALRGAARLDSTLETSDAVAKLELAQPTPVRRPPSKTARRGRGAASAASR